MLQAVDTAVQTNLDGEEGLPVPAYVDENVSAKVVKIIQSYTGVVNKMVVSVKSTVYEKNQDRIAVMV